MNGQRFMGLFGACIAALLTVAGTVRADPPPSSLSLPNMRAFPTSVKDAKYQTPLLPMHDGIGKPAPSDLDEDRQVRAICRARQDHVPERVKLCQRTPEIPLGGLMAKFGKYHQWLVVESHDGAIIHAAGLGTRRGVPGANGQTSPDWPYTKTFIVDHRKEPTRDCRNLPGIDPMCVKSQTPLGKSAGPWIPLRNDCNTFVRRVIDKCEKNPSRGQNHDVLPARRAIPPRTETPRSGLSPAKAASCR